MAHLRRGSAFPVPLLAPGETFSSSGEYLGNRNTAGLPPELQALMDEISLDDSLRQDVIQWAIENGVTPDPTNPMVVRGYQQARQTEAAEDRADRATSGGGSGRTQFASEAAVDWAQAGLLGQQSISERYQRAFDQATLKQQQRQSVFDRARDKIQLLQATDSLLDARRRDAVSFMIESAPLMVGPGDQFFPGMQPGGPAQTLGSRLGTNVPARRIPTQTLPLQQMVNAPVAGNKNIINRMLNPIINAPPGGMPRAP